jgi:hypothetical protein
MEEADELCSRIGILVAGRLACVGTAQHLKNRYSRGYSLEIELGDDDGSGGGSGGGGGGAAAAAAAAGGGGGAAAAAAAAAAAGGAAADGGRSGSVDARLRGLIERLEAIAGKAELVDWHKRLFKYQFRPAGSSGAGAAAGAAGAGGGGGGGGGATGGGGGGGDGDDGSDGGGGGAHGMLSQLFACIEEWRQRTGVETYSLSQTTLEQVFIGFAEKQNLVDQRMQEAREAAARLTGRGARWKK